MSRSTENTPDGAPVTPEMVSRRRFLGYASGLLGAIIGAALGLPLLRFFVGDAFESREAKWLDLGRTEDVHGGRPTLVRTSYLDTDGWRQTTRREAMYAVRLTGDEIVVFSNACTHLGCPVHWDEDAHLFLCPCHNGAFSIDGKVVKGPPPRPLDRLVHKVEDGVLYVEIGRA